MRIVTKSSLSYYKYVSRANYCVAPTYVQSRDDEYDKTPQYPPIERVDEESVAKKKIQGWYDRIKGYPTVEEKIFALNVPRYWGWKCFMVREGVIPFDNLTFAQFTTRTHIKEVETIPNGYSEKASEWTSSIKNDIIDAIEYQVHFHLRNDGRFKKLKPLEKENLLTSNIVNALNRVLISKLSEEVDHLKYLQMDYTPRVEAAWHVGSLVETVYKEKYPDGIPEEELPEEYLSRPSDKYFQYLGSPLLHVRHTDPLPPLISIEEATSDIYPVPFYEYDPHVALGYEMERRHLTNIPGFWPGDAREFSILSYHSSNHIKCRPPSYGEEDAKDASLSQIIFGSFGWLMSLAWYQGFSCYHNVTYPLVTQTVLTDGQEFMFASYQMNTTELQHSSFEENNRANICWVTPKLSLFEAQEDGKIKGFNEDTLKHLIGFYLNKTSKMECIMKPYLGQEIKYVADYPDDEKRKWLETKFKDFSANKDNKRTDFRYEVYDWERIFKIQFNQMKMAPRKRPFELRQNPYHTPMTADIGKYIPKHLRKDKDLPKWRQKKFPPTFYPV